MTFYLRKGDLLPKLRATLKDAAGLPINLSGAVVRFRMRRVGETGAPKVDAVATVVTATDGKVEYAWAGTDTDTPGTFDADWLVTYGSNPMTVPSDKHVTVLIGPALV